MTNLPQEATGATALSSRWNTVINKVQNASDTDVRIRGRKISAGTVVATTGSFSNISGSGYSIMQDEGASQISRSTVDFVGTGVTVTDTGSKTQVSIPSGGAAAYYGVKAEDYITSGDGSAGNPYNASAIQSAIDSLPSRGGFVFIKEGIWRGTSRIQLPGSAADTNKRITLQGAGAPRSHIYEMSGNDGQSGTHIQAGIDMYRPCDIYDLTIAPHPNDYNVSGKDCLRIVYDRNRHATDYAFLSGFNIERCRFWRGDYGIRFTGVNMGAVFWQMAQIVIKDISIALCRGRFRMSRDDFDSTAPSQG